MTAITTMFKAVASGIGGAAVLVMFACAAGVVTGAFLGSAVWAVRLIGGF